MTGMPLETHPRRTGSARSYATQSTPLPRSRAHGPAMGAVREGTSSRDFPSPWYTGCAGTKSRSSPWLTADDGQATGDRDSDPPSNFRIQRSRCAPPLIRRR
jgi:hypothetical protein